MNVARFLFLQDLSGEITNQQGGFKRQIEPHIIEMADRGSTRWKQIQDH